MNKNLPEICQKIATELGCTVLSGGNEYCWQIAGAEVPFTIYSVFATDKLDISLTYPRTADGKMVLSCDLYPTPDDCSIKVSAGRKPEVIAADIKRRFFPAAKAVYAACLKRAKQADDYGLQCAINAAKILNLFPGAVGRQESPNSHAIVTFSAVGELDCRAEIRREDVTVTLRGTIDGMTKALALLSKV